jgi:two-component system NtrC family response regulator
MPPPAILVVDDDQNLRRILEAKLERSPFDVSTATDLASAKDALEHGHFAVVVLDDRLPDGSSIANLAALKDLAPTSEFVLITAYEENAVRQQAEQAGAAEILFKPFDLDTLEAVVQNCAHRGEKV